MFLNILGYNRILVNRKTDTEGGVALFILNNLDFDVCADLIALLTIISNVFVLN